MNVVPLPGMLEKRLADLGGDRRALAALLVAEGWHPNNVERVLGPILADGGSRTSSPEGAKRERTHGVKPAAAHAPAPRRGDDRQVAAAPPRERRRRGPVLGPVRTPDVDRTSYGEHVSVDELERDVLADFLAPAAPKSNVVRLPLAERPRMFPGSGPRYDCVSESECLGRALEADKNASAVHCPRFCTHRETPSREQRIAEATAGKAEGWTR